MEGKECEVNFIADPHHFFTIYKESKKKLPIIENLLKNVTLSPVADPVRNQIYMIVGEKLLKYRVLLLYKKNDEFKCWRVDYGDTTQAKTLHDLPDTCSKIKQLSFKAGLYKTVGLDISYTDIHYTNPKLIHYFPSKQFSRNLKNVIKDRLAKAKKIVFIEDCIIDNTHFGQLIVTDKSDKEFNLINELVKEKVIACNEEAFNSIVSKYKKVHLEQDAFSESEANVSLGRGTTRRSLPKVTNTETDSKIYVENWLHTQKSSPNKLDTSCGSISLDENLCSEIDWDYDCSSSASCSSANVTTNDESLLNEISSKPRVSYEKKEEKPLNLFPGGVSKNFMTPSPNAKINKSRSSSRSTSFESLSNSANKSKNTPENFKLIPSGMDTCNKQYITNSRQGQQKAITPRRTNSSESLRMSTLDNSLKQTKLRASSSSLTENSLTRRQSFGSTNSLNTSNSERNCSNDNIPIFSHNNKDPDHLKIGCSCADCLSWNVSDFNVVSESFEPAPKKEIIKPPLLFRNLDNDDDNTSLDNIKTMSKLCNDLSLHKKATIPDILVHGTNIPFPQQNINHVPFTEAVLQALKNLGYEKARQIQCYGWPAIMRNMNTCLINSSRTGKTMTYIPAIFSMLMQKDTYYNLPKTNSPTALILCPESVMVEEVHDLILKFSKHVTGNTFNVLAVLSPIDITISKQLKQRCEILVTTPIMLLLLLSKNLINLKRLCHLVLERFDEILNKYTNPVMKIFKVVQEMLEHRNCPTQVQFICTAEHWQKNLETMLGKFNHLPIICIGNHLESALYGRADIQMVEVKSDLKPYKLNEIIKDLYQVYKTIVICNQDEVENIVKLLQLNGVRLVVADETMMNEHIYDSMKIWSSTTNGSNLVLITTDQIYSTDLRVKNATLLVNYSLTDTWTSFSKRFLSLIEEYTSPYLKNKVSFNCKIFTFVDNSCTIEFPRILNYFKSSGATLPPNLLKYSELNANNREKVNVLKKIELCNNIKMKGICTDYKCTKRHILTPKIDDTEVKHIGTLKYRIIDIIQINKYIVQPLESKDSNGNVKTFRDVTKEVEEQLKLQKSFEFPREIKLHGWYILDNKPELLRCKVTKILECNKITNLPEKVQVKGIDGGFIKNIDIAKIYEMPESLKKLAPTTIELVMANIAPINNENSFSLKGRKMAREELMSDTYKDKDCYFISQIILFLRDIVWVDDINVQRYLHYLKMPVRKFSLKKFLLEKNLIQSDDSHINKLYSMCEEAKIVLPKYEIKKELRIIKQATPQWAHITDDEKNWVYFSSGDNPGRFFVRLIKFDALFSKLQESIQDFVKESQYVIKPLPAAQIQVGNYYLAPDPEDNEVYCRAIIMNIEKSKALCYYVDFGDYSAVDLKNLKYMPDNLITKLPFQAIECKLHGIAPLDDDWSIESTDILYKYCFEKDTDFFRSLCLCKTRDEKGSFSSNLKYDVFLFDISDNSPIMINKLLIDCGFAVEAFRDSLKNDIDFNEPHANNVLDDVYYDSEEEIFTKKVSLEDDNFNFGDFDVDIENLDAFVEECQIAKEDEDKLKMKEIADGKCNQEEKNKENNLIPMTAGRSSTGPTTTFTPEIVWYQTDTEIKIYIKLMITDYELKVLASRVLYFKGFQNDRTYLFDIQLFGLVKKSYTHELIGPEIRVTLSKIVEMEWPRLVLKKQVMRNIKYNLDKCVIEDEDDKKRVFLDIGPDRPEDTLDDNEMIEEVASDSQTDSEFEDSDDFD